MDERITSNNVEYLVSPKALDHWQRADVIHDEVYGVL